MSDILLALHGTSNRRRSTSAPKASAPTSFASPKIRLLVASSAVDRLLLLAGLAEALGAFDRHFATVNLRDSAELTKELESSDFEETRIKSECVLGRKDHVLTWSHRLRVDGFQTRAYMRVSGLQ